MAAKRSAPSAIRLAATLTMLSSASEYSAALPVIHQAAAFKASTRQPIAMLPAAMRSPLVHRGGIADRAGRVSIRRKSAAVKFSPINRSRLA